MDHMKTQHHPGPAVSHANWQCPQVIDNEYSNVGGVARGCLEEEWNTPRCPPELLRQWGQTVN